MSGIHCKPNNRAEMWLTHYEVQALIQVAFGADAMRDAVRAKWLTEKPVCVGASSLLWREPGRHHGAKTRGRLIGPLDDVQYWRDLINDHLGPAVP